MRLLHYFVDLVALGADQQRHHALGHEDDDREGFGFDFFEFLVDVVEDELGALELLLHLPVINLHIRASLLEYYDHSNQG